MKYLMLISNTKLNKKNTQYKWKKVYFILYIKKSEDKKSIGTQSKNYYKLVNLCVIIYKIIYLAYQ